jgi:hypothetical protein
LLIEVASDHTNPICETTSVFIFDFGEIGGTFAATAYATLTGCIPIALLLVTIFMFVRWTGKLFLRSVGGTMLDIGMLIANVSEIVDL